MPTPEKIAIVGPASVGKTTITETYRRRFEFNSDVVVLGEGAELFFARNSGIPKESIHAVAIQKELQDFVLGREREAYKHGVRFIITDRSVIDPAVYTRFSGDMSGSKELLNGIVSWIPTYTEFLLPDPADVPYEVGPYRKETSQERFAIHSLFITVLTENNLPYEVVSGSRQNRIRIIDSVIERYYINTK